MPRDDDPRDGNDNADESLRSLWLAFLDWLRRQPENEEQMEPDTTPTTELVPTMPGVQQDDDFEPFPSWFYDLGAKRDNAADVMAPAVEPSSAPEESDELKPDEGDRTTDSNDETETPALNEISDQDDISGTTDDGGDSASEDGDGTDGDFDGGDCEQDFDGGDLG